MGIPPCALGSMKDLAFYPCTSFLPLCMRAAQLCAIIGQWCLHPIFVPGFGEIAQAPSGQQAPRGVSLSTGQQRVDWLFFRGHAETGPKHSKTTLNLCTCL